ncbi:MAG: ribonuclease III [Rickettsiales bacterium]|jgi:ribonuclease III|nr:ribonuclease III [Rickettsiales bacterium]
MSEIFNYNFKDKTLYQRAITHSSLGLDNYELLEFLGDKVLSLIITEYLYHQYPSRAEGAVAKKHAYLASGSVLSAIALREQLDQVILVSHGERKEGGHNNPANLEDCLEAILGAIYLDSDLGIIRQIVLDLWEEYFTEVKQNIPVDPKSRLQELLQKNRMDLPQYKIINKEGLDHKPIFTVELSVQGYQPLTAMAPLKKEAEKELALKMIDILEQNEK